MNGQFTLNTRGRWLAASVVVAAIATWGMLVAGIAPAHAVGTASISGHVTDASTGLPVAGTDVYASGMGSGFGSSTTDANGDYTITGLDADSYVIDFVPPSGSSLLEQYWGGAWDYPSAQRLAVADGAAKTGIGIALMHGGTISGTVTRADSGVPVEGIEVWATGPGYGGAVTDSAGKYSITWLVPGTYTVQTDPFTGLNNQNDLVYTTKQTTATPGATSTVNFALAVGGHISGRVDIKAMGSTPWADVTAYKWNGTSWTTADQSTALGAYAIRASGLGALPVGQYTVKFAYPGMCTQYWSGKFGSSPAAAAADKVSVTAAHTTTNIMAYLTPTCSKSTVTGPTPTISGTLAVGSKLTANAGTWKPAPVAKKYQWKANGTNITGATASTFTLTSSQAGKNISVSVTGSRPGMNSATKTSASTAKIMSAATPTVNGTKAVGFTLTAHHGTWTSATTFSYAWYANGTYITGSSGATHSTFKLTTAQKGKQITVKVTGKRTGYATVSKTSTPSAKVALTATPTIGGTMKVGYTLTAHPNTWTTGTTFTYKWYASGVAITGATASTFKLTSAQRGKTIKVAVTGKLTGYATVTRTSASTAKIL